MTAMRLPAAGGLWRTQSYHPWMEPRNGGMLASLKVGLNEGGGERLSRSYAYNSFGDITALTEGTTSYTFTYDGLGRLTSAYGRSYSYDGASRLSAFNGQAYGYGDSGPYHAVDRIAGADRFDYDANGNMVKRNKGLSDQQTLVWDAENRLSQVQDSNGDLVERYWYGVDGARVKKVSGNTTTYTFFGYYEEEVTDGTTTAISYYIFGSMRVAVKRGNTLYHLHGDHLGSTSLTTAGSAVEASRTYYAYGSERSASGDLQTDRPFTGQKRDASGLRGSRHAATWSTTSVLVEIGYRLALQTALGSAWRSSALGQGGGRWMSDCPIGYGTGGNCAHNSPFFITHR